MGYRAEAIKKAAGLMLLALVVLTAGCAAPGERGAGPPAASRVAAVESRATASAGPEADRGLARAGAPRAATASEILRATPSAKPAPAAASPAPTATPAPQRPDPTLPGMAVRPDAATSPAQTAAPAGVQTAPGSADRDVTYCSPGGEPQKMDIFYPAGTAGPALPTIFYVHGGAWTGGDKEQGEALWARSFLGQSYVFVSINYRLAPRHKFPAQIEDVKCAVRFLRAHAAQLRIDPNRIGAMGASAGGHLVVLLGTAGPGAGFDRGRYLDQSSRVQAVVDLYGPADLPSLMAGSTQLEQYQVPNVFGATSARDPVLARRRAAEDGHLLPTRAGRRGAARDPLRTRRRVDGRRQGAR